MKNKLILSIVLASIINTGFAGDVANQVTQDFVKAIDDNNTDQIDKLIVSPSLDLAHKINGTIPILIYAIQANKIPIAKKILEEAVNVSFNHRRDKNSIINARTSGNETALMFAIQENELDLANELINMGADVKVQAVDGLTALILAIVNGNENLINNLLAHGASLIVETKEGKKNLVNLLKEGNVKKKVVEFQNKLNQNLLDSILSLRDKKREENKEVLEKIQKLINQGANVNAKFTKGQTALMQASRYGYLNIAKMLLEAGADVNEREENGFSPIAFAIQGYFVQKNPISLKIYKEMLSLLLQYKADINIANKDGLTPLMQSVYGEIGKRVRSGGDYDLVKFILQYKPNINAQNNNGNTALITADTFGIVELLLQSGADPNIKNKDGENALMWHIAKGSTLGEIDLLLQAKADPNAIDKEGRNSLDYLKKSKYKNDEIKELVNLLKKYGAKEQIG